MALSIWEYVNDPLDREDYETHIFDNVFALFADKLPTEPPVPELRNECPLWTNGVEIMCASEWLAETIADALERISGEKVAHTGYYDPEEDKRDNCVDRNTGWWYVDFD